MGMCPLHLALLRSHLDEEDEVEGENKGNARFEGGNDETNNARTIRKREENNSNNTKDLGRPWRWFFFFYLFIQYYFLLFRWK